MKRKIYTSLDNFKLKHTDVISYNELKICIKWKLYKQAKVQANTKETKKKEVTMDYVIYTDGAYSKSKDLGAFVFIIVDENENEVCRMGHVTPSETNNRQEIKAIIAAVSKLPDDARKVRIISDSMYALNTLSGEWMRRANHDLFKLWEKTKRKKAVVELEFLWVKGHSGDYYNELCDELCNELIGHNVNSEYAKYNRVK